MARHHRSASSGGGPRQRQLRVGEELRHALARILGRGELHDPAAQATRVTVTEVRISPDLKNATVFVMPLGGGQAAEVAAALQRGAAFLRGLLAREVPLRHVPTLRFTLDTSFEHASRIEALLHRPEVERDLASRDPASRDPGAEGEEDGA